MPLAEGLDHPQGGRLVLESQERVRGGKGRRGIVTRKAFLDEWNQINPSHEQALDVSLDTLLQGGEPAHGILGRSERRFPLSPEKLQLFVVLHTINQGYTVASPGRHLSLRLS